MAINEFDTRQISKMDEQIASFQSGSISLGDLVEDLVFLRNALEQCEDDWESEFTEKLTDLESVNSYLIEKNIYVVSLEIFNE